MKKFRLCYTQNKFILLLYMGHSHSKTNTNIVNNVVNTNDINSINKSVVESAIEVLVKNASKCSSSVNQSNTCSMNNSKIASNFSIGGNQSNKASVDFSCIQADTAASEMETAMTQALQGQLNSITDSELANKINAAAAAASKSGAGSTGGGANANVNTGVSNNIKNETKVVIENIYKRNLKNNFNSETVSECIGKTEQKNNISATGDEVGGSADVNCTQSNTLEQVQECKQMNEAVNSVLAKTAQELGFKIETVNTTASKIESKSSAESENTSTGVFQDIGNAVSGVVSSIGDALGIAGLGVMAPYAIVSCCVCCLLISICLSCVMMGHSASDSMSSQHAGTTNGINSSVHSYDMSSFTSSDI